VELSSSLLSPRRQTRRIDVGGVPVGDGAPITVQSMTTTKTADVDGTLAQIYALAAAGADIVRCTCNEEAAAEGLAHIVPRSPVPIVADIHFHHEMVRPRAGSSRARPASAPCWPRASATPSAIR